MPTRINRLALLLAASGTFVLGMQELWAQLPNAIHFASAEQLNTNPSAPPSGSSDFLISSVDPGTKLIAIARPVFPQADEAKSNDSDSKPPVVKGPAEAAGSDSSPSDNRAKASSRQGGLKPRPSSDVLDILSTPNTKYEGVTPESAAAKRAMGPIALPLNRGWMLQSYAWQSSNTCHQPLYFEDAMLERHGHKRFPCLQPVVSGTKFLGQMAVLPYVMAMHAPCECRYELGHFRPGSCAPPLKDTLPWDRRAAVVQGLAITGVFVGLPW